MHMTTTDLSMYLNHHRKCGTGLTHDLLEAANEQGAMFIVVDRNHAQDIKRLMNDHDFGEVRVATLTQNIIGIRGPIIFDHHTLDLLFSRIGSEQRNMVCRIRELEKEVLRIERHNTDLTNELGGRE